MVICGLFLGFFFILFYWGFFLFFFGGGVCVLCFPFLKNTPIYKHKLFRTDFLTNSQLTILISVLMDIF